MSEALTCRREDFEMPPGVTYLNAAYMGVPLRACVEASERALRKPPWETHPADFFSLPDRARELFGQVIGGDAGGVAIVPGVSYAIGIAAANLPVAVPGRRVLVLDEQFPSNLYPWQAAGADLLVVPRPAGAAWTDAVLGLIDERVAVAALPHCHWTDGTILDLERIGDRCREVGTALVIDATQSLGVLPIDVARVRPAMLCSASYKWLLGPYGVTYLWLAPEHRDWQPLEHGWATRAGAEDFTRLVDYTPGRQPGGRGLDAGERSNFVLLPFSIAALEQLLAWQPARTQAYLRALTDLAAREAEARGMQVAPRAARAGHMLGARLARGVEGLAARLAGEGVHVSQRGSALRIAPHLWCDEADVHALFAAIDRLGLAAA
jgi:selenocysteine lyase/cysteine desulfurase